MINKGQWVNYHGENGDQDALVKDVHSEDCLSLVVVNSEGEIEEKGSVMSYKAMLETNEETHEISTKRGKVEITREVTRRKPGNFWRL